MVEGDVVDVCAIEDSDDGSGAMLPEAAAPAELSTGDRTPTVLCTSRGPRSSRLAGSEQQPFFSKAISQHHSVLEQL